MRKSKEQLETNRIANTDKLKQAGILFKSDDLGTRLIMESYSGYVYFFPCTGNFVEEDGRFRNGVISLIKLCKLKKTKI